MIPVSEVASLAHLAIAMLLKMSASRRFILRIYISIRIRISISISCILHLHRVSSVYNPIYLQLYIIKLLGALTISNDCLIKQLKRSLLTDCCCCHPC